MATEKELSSQNFCANDPNFAIICSFFDRFGASCGITCPTFSEFQEMIEWQPDGHGLDVPPELIEIHVKLLRKIRKSVSAEKWERALVKFCHSYYCSEDGWELERCGYKNCKVPVKLRILKTLLDAQFDLNSKFKTDINKLTAEELRIEPLGKDKVGQSYWCQFDSAANVRVYKEDQDEETWKMVAKDREGLVDLITQLSSGDELLGLEIINEDSNSQEVEKPIIDTGQVEITTSEENTTDNTSSVDIKAEENVKEEDLSNSDSPSENVTTGKTNGAITLSKEDANENSLNLKETPTSFIEVLKSGKDHAGYVNIKTNPDSKSEEDLKPEIVVESNVTDTTRNGVTDTASIKSTSEKLNESSEDLSNIKYPTKENNNGLSKLVLINNSDSALNQTLDQSNLDVAEEIKQRSLVKSNNSSLFKGKPSGSKLDIIFGRKLEQNLPTEDSKSLKTESSKENSEPDHRNTDDESCRQTSTSTAKEDNSSPVEITSTGKRKPEEETVDQPLKKKCVDFEPDVEVGEEIEEPLMIIKGEGSGHDCDTGNPNREGESAKPTDGKNNPPSSETENTKQTTSSLEKNRTCDENSKEIELNSNNDTQHDKLVTDEIIGDKDLTDFKIKNPCNLENEGRQNKKEVRDISDLPVSVESSSVLDTSADADKSIEEQMSFLTGESLSPNQNDGEANNLEQQNSSKSIEYNEEATRRKSLNSIELADNRAIAPEAKKIKVNDVKTDIFGDKISDTCNELVKSGNKLKRDIDDLKSISATKNKFENKSSEESEFHENSQNSTILNCKTDLSNSSERLLSTSSVHAGLSQINAKHEIIIEPKVSSKTNQESEFSVEKETASDDNSKSTNRNKRRSVSEEDNDPTLVHDEEQNNAKCENTTKKPKKNLKSGLEPKEKGSDDESKCNIEDGSISNSNNNLASNSEKSCEKPQNGKTTVPKKSPKPRKKIFTSRSKKRSKQSQAHKSNKVEAINSPEKNVTPKKEDSNTKETISDVSSKDKTKPDVQPKPISNRKRRGSCKRSGTEKDSEDDIVSDKKDNTKTGEVEIGGKRRKLKGKRAPNKTLRKSVEEKRNSKSSSEEEANSNDSEDFDCKKTASGGTVSKDQGKVPKGKTGEPTSETDEPAQAKKKKSQGRNSRAFSGIDLNIDINATSRSVRQSSRLAQLKIKEQADTKHGAENRKSPEKKSKKNKDIDGKKQKGNLKKKSKYKDESEEDYQDEEPLSERKKGKKKKKKMHPVKAFNERNPWKSSSGSSSEAEDEEEDHFDDIAEEEDELQVNLKSDHEFSPESDLEDEDYKPVRRARTAKKEEPSKEDGEELKKMDDFACEKCGKKDHPEWILLCDTCDHGWHASCLRPSLMLVPEGDWHCPPCQHSLLVKQLQETLRTYDKNAKKRENEELRKKRLAYVGISLDNVLPHQIQHPRERGKKIGSDSSEASESESGTESEDSDEPVYQLRQRRQGTTSYRFNEFDDLINSAIQDEVDANAVLQPSAAIVQASVRSEGEGKIEENEGKVEESKTEEKNEHGGAEVAKTTQGSENKEKKIKKTDDEESDEGSSESEGEEEEFPCVVPKRNKVLPRGKKKHRRLNCLDDASDDDDGSDEDFKGSSSEEEEEDEEEYSDDSEVGRRGRSKRGSMVPVRRSSRTRTSRIDKEFINDDSEESDAPRRKKTKKLWSESDSESDDSTWGKRKKKKNFGGSGRRKFQKNKRFTIEDELSGNESSKVPKKKRQRKIKYGGLDDLAVEELPTRRTRGRQINYLEVIGSDSDEAVLKSKSFKKSVIKDDEEDDFVAEKEEKDESGSSEDDVEDEEKSSYNEEESDDAETSVKEVRKEEKPKQDVAPNVPSPNKAQPPNKVSPPSKITPPNSTPPKNINDKPAPKRRGRPPKAMIAPPPERLITEDERYKAVVSKVSTLGHSDPDNATTQGKGQAAPLDPKFLNRSPPIKIRSGVPVNAAGRKSPMNDPLFFPAKLGPGQTENTAFPLQMQRTLVPFHPGPQSFTARKSINPSGPSIKTENDEVDELDEDYMDDIEEDEDEDNSDDDVLEEGEIPKKVAKRMARMEERMVQLEQARMKQEAKPSQPASPVSAPPAANTPSTVEQKPLLRVVSPLKLMANPPGPLQTPFMHNRMGPRMQMPPSARMPMQMRPPPHSSGGMIQPADDGSPGKRRGRGRGKKPGPDKPEQEIMAVGPGGGSVIRGMLQQQQPYQYSQQYPPPHPRIPFNPQRMPRPPFHPGHHPMDPSPSGGGPITVKQEPGGGPSGPPTSSPVQIPGKPPPSSAAPYHPPPPPQHRYDSGPPRPPNYPPQSNPPPRPPYGSYPPPHPPGPGANYHYGSYPPPQEPQPYPVQQPYSEQFSDPPAPPAPATPPPLQAPPANKTFNEEESGGEFGGLVSYFSSQREDDIDT